MIFDDDLRPFLARLLGWSDEQAVEVALRSLELVLEHRAALVLHGEDDLVPLALTLHLRMLGPDSPFVVCDPEWRTIANLPIFCESGVSALEHAAYGSLCLQASRLPSDFPALAARLRDAKDVCVICVGELGDSDPLPLPPAPLTLPALSGRTDELDRIIVEFADDAIDELCVSGNNFTSVDLAWVRNQAASSLSEIAKAALWVVALRLWHDVPTAARYLGEDPALMSEWFGHRGVQRVDALPAAPPPRPPILHISTSTLAEIRELSVTNPALAERWAQGVEDSLAAMQRKGISLPVDPGSDKPKR